MSAPVEHLMDELEARGVRLSRAGDRLRVEGPVGAVTPTLRAALVERKAELLNLIPEPNSRPVVHFRLPGHPSNAWATMVGRPGEHMAVVIDELRQRWPFVELAPSRYTKTPS
jgi:hypothetical protein